MIDIDPNTPTATNQIYDFITQYMGRSESREVNRASSAPRCHKARWYQRKGYEGEPLSPRAIVNFTLGDLTEHVVKFFIMRGCVGEGKLYSQVDFGKPVGKLTVQNGKEITMYEQETITADIGGITVTAHVDGWGKRHMDGKWELIEVKSAADYGFEDFKENGPGDYLKQAMVCLSTGKAKELDAYDVRYFYLKKNTGHLWDRLHQFNPFTFGDVIEEYKIANGEDEPKAPYVAQPEMFRSKPTGRMVLPWQCAYCSFVKHCKPTAELEIKNGKPKFYIKEKAE
jgi:hypothetical protein